MVSCNGNKYNIILRCALSFPTRIVNNLYCVKSVRDIACRSQVLLLLLLV